MDRDLFGSVIVHDSPGIFTFTGTGIGPAAVQNAFSRYSVAAAAYGFIADEIQDASDLARNLLAYAFGGQYGISGHRNFADRVSPKQVAEIAPSNRNVLAGCS